MIAFPRLFHTISFKPRKQCRSAQLLALAASIHPNIIEVTYQDLPYEGDDVLQHVTITHAPGAFTALLSLLRQPTMQLTALALCYCYFDHNAQCIILRLPSLRKVELQAVKLENTSLPLPVSQFITHLHIKGVILGVQNFLARCAPELLELSLIDSPLNRDFGTPHLELLHAIVGYASKLRSFVAKGAFILRLQRNEGPMQQHLGAFLSATPALTYIHLEKTQSTFNTTVPPYSLGNLEHIGGDVIVMSRFIVGRPVKSVHLTAKFSTLEDVESMIGIIKQSSTHIEELKLEIDNMVGFPDLISRDLPELRSLDICLSEPLKAHGCSYVGGLPEPGDTLPRPDHCPICTEIAGELIGAIQPHGSLQKLRVELKWETGPLVVTAAERWVKRTVQPLCSKLNEVEFEIWGQASQTSWTPKRRIRMRRVWDNWTTWDEEL